MAGDVVLKVWSTLATILDAPTVLPFHGQSGNLDDCADRLRKILAAGYGALASRYRRFPGNRGESSELALISDRVQLFDWLVADGDAVVLHGQSLGGNIAAATVTAKRLEAMLLVRKLRSPRPSVWHPNATCSCLLQL